MSTKRGGLRKGSMLCSMLLLAQLVLPGISAFSAPTGIVTVSGSGTASQAANGKGGTTTTYTASSPTYYQAATFNQGANDLDTFGGGSPFFVLRNMNNVMSLGGTTTVANNSTLWFISTGGISHLNGATIPTTNYIETTANIQDSAISALVNQGLPILQSNILGQGGAITGVNFTSLVQTAGVPSGSAFQTAILPFNVFAAAPPPTPPSGGGQQQSGFAQQVQQAQQTQLVSSNTSAIQNLQAQQPPTPPAQNGVGQITSLPQGITISCIVSASGCISGVTNTITTASNGDSLANVVMKNFSQPGGNILNGQFVYDITSQKLVSASGQSVASTTGVTQTVAVSQGLGTMTTTSASGQVLSTSAMNVSGPMTVAAMPTGITGMNFNQGSMGGGSITGIPQGGSGVMTASSWGSGAPVPQGLTGPGNGNFTPPSGMTGPGSGMTGGAQSLPMMSPQGMGPGGTMLVGPGSSGGSGSFGQTSTATFGGPGPGMTGGAQSVPTMSPQGMGPGGTQLVGPGSSGGNAGASGSTFSTSASGQAGPSGPGGMGGASTSGTSLMAPPSGGAMGPVSAPGTPSSESTGGVSTSGNQLTTPVSGSNPSGGQPGQIGTGNPSTGSTSSTGGTGASQQTSTNLNQGSAGTLNLPAGSVVNGNSVTLPAGAPLPANMPPGTKVTQNADGTTTLTAPAQGGTGNSLSAPPSGGQAPSSGGQGDTLSTPPSGGQAPLNSGSGTGNALTTVQLSGGQAPPSGGTGNTLNAPPSGGQAPPSGGAGNSLNTPPSGGQAPPSGGAGDQGNLLPAPSSAGGNAYPSPYRDTTNTLQYTVPQSGSNH